MHVGLIFHSVGQQIVPKEGRCFGSVIGVNIHLAAFVLREDTAGLVMIPVMIFISWLYDSVNEFVRGGGGSKIWRGKPASIISISLSDYTAALEQGSNIREKVDVHEMASLVMFWVKQSLINTLICGG